MPRLLLALALVAVGCGSTPPDASYEPGVRVEVARVEGQIQPPVFRWNAPIAARVTVQRGRTVVWEIAEDDQRGPILSPHTYGTAASASSRLRVLVPPEPLLPQRLYTITIIGYDGTVFEGTFSVNARVEP